jgi:hypothetical protein
LALGQSLTRQCNVGMGIEEDEKKRCSKKKNEDEKKK